MAQKKERPETTSEARIIGINMVLDYRSVLTVEEFLRYMRLATVLHMDKDGENVTIFEAIFSREGEDIQDRYDTQKYIDNVLKDDKIPLIMREMVVRDIRSGNLSLEDASKLLSQMVEA